MEWFYFEEGNDDKVQLKQIKNDVLNNERIKFLKYGMYFYSFIVTTDNNVYCLESNSEEMKKVNFSFGKIKLLECGTKITIIVNEDNKIYFSQVHPLFVFKELIIKNLQKSIKFVRIREGFIYFITEDDFIYYFFKNRGYQMIESSENSQSEKIQVKMITNPTHFKIKDLQCGFDYVILLDILGNIYKIKSNDNEGNIETLEINFFKINLQFKVKQIICHNQGTILLNEYNELYGDGRNSDGALGLDCFKTSDFTRIAIPSGITIKSLYKTSALMGCNIFITKDNQLYGTGECTDGIFGIPNKECLKNTELEGLFDIYYINKFTLINFKTDKKYINLFIHHSKLIFATSDYKLSNGDCENDSAEFDKFKLQCLQKVEKYQLIDITFVCLNK